MKTFQHFVASPYRFFDGVEILRPKIDSGIPLVVFLILVDAAFAGFRFNCSRPSVFCLLIVGCPFAIVLAVIAIIVDAIKAHTFGPVSHIAKEIREVFPFGRIANSSSPVVAIVLVAWAIAPLLHVAPYPVDGRPHTILDDCVSMNGGVIFANSIGEASTAFSSSRPEVPVVDGNDVTAVAFTEPLIMPMSCDGPISTSDNKLSESSSSFIDVVSIDHDTSISLIGGNENLGGYPTRGGV